MEFCNLNIISSAAVFLRPGQCPNYPVRWLGPETHLGEL